MYFLAKLSLSDFSPQCISSSVVWGSQKGSISRTSQWENTSWGTASPEVCKYKNGLSIIHVNEKLQIQYRGFNTGELYIMKVMVNTLIVKVNSFIIFNIPIYLMRNNCIHTWFTHTYPLLVFNEIKLLKASTMISAQFFISRTKRICQVKRRFTLDPLPTKYNCTWTKSNFLGITKIT